MLDAKACILGLACVGFVVLLVATRSWRLALACFTSILAIIATFVGFMVAFFHLEPGMVECVLLMVAVS